eukprot:COSAG03_NODE_4265_length_1615_cov_94.953826_2_plen_97_part_00
MPPGHCGSAAQTTARTPVVATRPAKDERVLQDALGLIDSPLPGASWHTDALTAASFFFVSTRLFLPRRKEAEPLRMIVQVDSIAIGPRNLVEGRQR